MSSLESNGVAVALAEEQKIVLAEHQNEYVLFGRCAFCPEQVEDPGGIRPRLASDPLMLVCPGCLKKRSPALWNAMCALYEYGLLRPTPCGCNNEKIGEFIMIGVNSFQICRKHGTFSRYEYYPPPDPLTVVSRVPGDGSPGMFLDLFKGLKPVCHTDNEFLLEVIRDPDVGIEITAPRDNDIPF